MGREHAGTGKLFHFCAAGLVALALSGCALLGDVVRVENGDEYKKERVKEEKKEVRAKPGSGHLQQAKRLMSEGNYEGSLKESQKALALAGRNAPGDEALFTMGLVYAHYKNPRKDFKQSLDLFNKLLREYPQSPLAEQARVWVGVLGVIEQSKQVDIEIEEMKKGLAK